MLVEMRVDGALTFAFTRPAAAAAARRPAARAEQALSPCEVLELSSRQKVPPQTLLNALSLVGMEVVNSVPAPILRATVAAAKAAHGDPKADKKVVKALDDTLNVWKTRGRYGIPEGRLGHIWQGADYTIVGNVIHVGAPPEEDTTAHSIALSGPESALTTLLEKDDADKDKLRLVTDEVVHTGWIPSRPLIGRLCALTVERASKFEGHHDNFSALCGLLNAIEERQPGAIGLEVRQGIQDALLAHPRPLWPAYAGHYYEAVTPLVAGSPELKASLLARLHETAAPALLVKADLDEAEWTRLKLAVRQGPRFDNDHTPKELNKAELRRRLADLPPRAALESLDALAAQNGVDAHDAQKAFMDQMLARRAPGDVIHLMKASTWGHDLNKFFPAFSEGVRQDRLDWTIDQVESGLRELSKGLVGGHEVAVAGLAALPGDSPMKERVQRYRAVLKHTNDGHGSIGASVHTPRLLGLLNEVPTAELGKHLEGVDRLKSRGWKQGECLEAIFKAVEGAPEKRGYELLHSLMLDFAPEQFEQAVDFYQGIKTVESDDALAMFKRIHPRTPSGADTLAVLPAVDRLAAQGREDVALALLERVQKLHGNDPYAPAAELGLAELERGGDLQGALSAAFGNLLLGQGEKSRTGIEEARGTLTVGGTTIRKRKR